MDDPFASTTLYPKITNHIHEIAKTLRHRHDISGSEGAENSIPHHPIPITGTIKLHGTHADILISSHPASTITFQSRNNPKLQVTADNYGFAALTVGKRDTLLNLRDQYIARWQAMNPKAQLDQSIPVTVAGEWIGSGIQKGVAIANLSRRLVIISAKVNGSWVPDESYADIEAPEQDIFNISRGGFYHARFDPSNPESTVVELEELAEKVAAHCPFAASFGVTGEGEGLVWKLDPYVSDPTLWFKTKGGKFKPTFVPPPKALPATKELKRALAETVARDWCGEQRLEQGWDYLREKGVQQNMKGIGEFLKWVQVDILTEEKGYITEHDVDDGLLRQAIIGIAKPWFLARIQQ